MAVMSGHSIDSLMDMMESGSADGELNNFTVTCVARSIQDPIPFSSVAAIVVRAFQALAFLLLIVAGISLNCLVIVLVAKYKKLQTLSFLVSLQIILLDLLLSVMLVTSLTTAIANRWLFGEYLCIITGVLLSVTLLARIFLMCVFVIDRFLAVFMPYFYPKHKLKVTVSLSIASWVFAVVCSVAMLPGLLDCYRLSSALKMCALSSECSFSCSVYFSYTLVIIPATVVPVILYVLLYCKGRKIRQAMNSDPAAGEVYRREWKATITFSLMFIAVFVVVLPTSAIGIIGNVLISETFILYTVQAVNFCILSLLTVTDPIVVMRDGDVKDILSKIKKDIIFRNKVTPLTD